MWTIFQPPPNIHVDRLVHMVHMPKSQPWRWWQVQCWLLGGWGLLQVGQGWPWSQL
eukprot:COSAG01_NODE_4998_length_4557_cov_61.708903_2_plen_56_part_00